MRRRGYEWMTCTWEDRVGPQNGPPKGQGQQIGQPAAQAHPIDILEKKLVEAGARRNKGADLGWVPFVRANPIPN